MTNKENICFGIAQLNYHVGAIEANTAKIIEALDLHKTQGADIVIFSELAICGYSPQDLLYRKDFHEKIASAIKLIQLKTKELNIVAILGVPIRDANKSRSTQSGEFVLYNSLLVIENGIIKHTYHKRSLPNYGVFDEKRYFSPGTDNGIYEFKGIKLGLLICEDIWDKATIKQTAEAGAQILISIHGSPYYLNKQNVRYDLVENIIKQFNIPLIYVNQVGGQDELIFDGHSFALTSNAYLLHSLPAFEVNHCQVKSIDLFSKILSSQLPLASPSPEADKLLRGLTHTELESLYQALSLATKDYVTKNGFDGIVLGLSGGIDSALTLAIAVNALGAEACRAVMMPFRYTSEISIIDAKEEADNLGVQFDIVPIEPMFESFIGPLKSLFSSNEKDTTEENLQARCRGVILMALSNKERKLVLTTSNKSEVAVGYSTLYGDMAGGFNVLKDLPKTWVYALSEYLNLKKEIIPNRVITRPPSAELAPDQTDQDNLPPYEVLDPLLKAYVEDDAGVEDLITLGFSLSDIKRVLRLVNLNEYKRAQSPIGPKLTKRSFAKERRYPITNGFNPVNK
ncbi:NAD+ synthase [Thorsellia kenyensis]|uniref:Glutamine-dependent NAD(+) synthetase n=1 Tax=Thorsellia kenyensis TaxID=1549888 RepID=A0ABV6CBX8_9GAMM